MAQRNQPYTASRDIVIRTKAWVDAVKYYESVLGLTVTHRDKNIVGFEAGGLCLYVESGEPHGPVLELLVSDVPTAKQRLLNAGCSLIEEDPSMPRCYLKDPYGLTYNIGLDRRRP
jgi:hypothetical protein